jgi:predicted TIM-barrel fold metal-dependent hydrolase
VIHPEPVVDTHIHLFDLGNPDLRYAWLDPANPHPILTPSEVERIASLNYRLTDFQLESGESNVSKAVHVQAAVGIDDPVVETAWLQAQADAAGFTLAIIGYADLQGDDLNDVLDRHEAASPRFRGIRDFGHEQEYLADPRWIDGVKALGNRGLVLSLDCTWERMPLAAAMAREASGTVIVLDHMGLPLSRDDDYYANWRHQMSILGKVDNLVCKISEVTMIDHAWNPERVRPWLEHCLDAFGSDRCVIGTNWPVDSLYATYPELISLYRQVAELLSPSERTALLSGNAERLYRI